MNNIFRNCLIGVISILLIVGIIYIYKYLTYEEKIIEETSNLYELVSKDKFLNQSPIIAKIKIISSTEKNIKLSTKYTNVMEYKIIIKEVYKGNLSEEEIMIYDDQYKSYTTLINNNKELVYGTNSSVNIIMEPDKEYLLFLIKDTEINDAYRIFCGFQGIFTYNKEKNVYINEFGTEISEKELHGI